MTTFSRTVAPLIALLAIALAAQASLSAPAARAASPYNVTISAQAAAYPAGGDGILTVHVEAADVSKLPAFTYDVEGGEIVNVGPLLPVNDSAAESTVHVTRSTAGVVRLRASFAGSDLATAEARFAEMGTVRVNIAFTGAGPDAAARTWRFEVRNASGTLVQALQAGTNGDELTTSVSTNPLPYGMYTVNQVLGNDTKLACGGGAFYAVTAPTGAETTVELAAAVTDVNFTIALCADAPQLSFQAPVDPVAPSADVAPGETPINEVRGARAEGPGDAAATPLPPRTGTGTETGSGLSLLLVLGALFVTAAPATYATSRISSRRRR